MKRSGRQKRHQRITKRIQGRSSCPRLVVFRSKKHIYVQAVDDVNHKALASCSTLDKEFKTKNNKSTDKAAAKEIGRLAASLLLKLGLKEVAFDRGGYKYHGRVKSLAEGAREGGLKF